MIERTESFTGGCACGYVRYEMVSEPLIVHGCHCRSCQRQGGSAFAVNALIESDRVHLSSGKVSETTVPSSSGAGQRIARCPKCQIAVWSHYQLMGKKLSEIMRFVRVGTLDNPDRHPPDIHIYTEDKQPWLNLPRGVLAVEKYYRIKDIYSVESLERHIALKKLSECKAGGG